MIARLAFLLLLAVPLEAQAAPAQDNKPAGHHNFLVRPFYNKSVAILAAIHVGPAAWDGVTTRMVLDRGGYERDPLMRPFAGNSGALAATTAGEVWLSAFVADRMKHSHSIILRKGWWLPQAVSISLDLWVGVNNTVVLRR